MKRLLTAISLIIVVFAAKAEAPDTVQVTLPTDVRASYLVVTPGQGFTSMLGHAALRMQCPSVGLDYCFTYRSPEIGNEFTAMTMRTLPSGMVPVPFADFCQEYQAEGRGISEYPLRLTLDEARKLWKALDYCVSLGLYRHVNYITNGCAQEAASMVILAVHDRAIPFDSLTNELLPYDNRRQILARYKDTSTWMGFIGHSLYGGSPDDEVHGADKLIMPLDVAEVFDAAGLVDQPQVLSRPTNTPEAPLVSPLVFAIVWLVMCLIPMYGKAIHWLVLTLHFIVGVLVAWLVFVSSSPGTEWNWLLLAFNPVPLIVERWAGRRTYALYVFVLATLLVFMLTALGRLFFVEQILIVAGLLVRTIHHLRTLYTTKQ